MKKKLNVWANFEEKVESLCHFWKIIELNPDFLPEMYLLNQNKTKNIKQCHISSLTESTNDKTFAFDLEKQVWYTDVGTCIQKSTM